MGGIPMRGLELFQELSSDDIKVIKYPPVCIPSYSRPEGAAIKACINHPDLNALLFIRKEQEALYKSIDLRKVKLKGVSNIGTTRRAMMNYLRSKGVKECFMVDDDVSIVDFLYPYNGSKGVFMRPSLLNAGLKSGWNPIAFPIWYRLIHELPFPVAVCGLPLRQFSFGMPKRLARLDCTIPMQCFYINISELDRLGLNFESNEIVGWEDAALSYKVVKVGGHIAQIQLLTYSCPEMGLNAGGIQDQYEDPIERSKVYSKSFMKNVAKGDPAIIQKVFSNGQVNIRINWRKVVNSEA